MSGAVGKCADGLGCRTIAPRLPRVNAASSKMTRIPDTTIFPLDGSCAVQPGAAQAGPRKAPITAAAQASAAVREGSREMGDMRDSGGCRADVGRSAAVDLTRRRVKLRPFGCLMWKSSMIRGVAPHHEI